jgi:hypothetical protein
MSDTMVPSVTTYRVAEAVKWAVETRGLLLTDGRGLTYSLGYPESAVWDLFSRGCHPQKAASMLRHIASLPTAEAEQLVTRCLEEWVRLGLMQRQ